MLKYIFIYTLVLIINDCADAQVIDNTVSYRNINNNNYLRLYYDNDYFTATDKYYTQGIDFELVNPCFKNFPISNILIHPSAFQNKYGIAIETDDYTPTSISHNNILLGDRPFAATLFLKTFLISTDTEKHIRISSDFAMGAIGRAAGGYWMQVTIHRWLDDAQPHGWQNQIADDAILNYEINYEQELVSASNILLLNAYGQLRAGTLSDKAGAGVTFMFGKFNSPFSGTDKKNKLSIYFYEQPIVSFIGYDATLQGGFFNRTSPYTIAASDIERLTFQDNAGLIFSFKKIFLEYTQSFLTKEFKSETYHRWGGIRLGVSL